LGTRHHSVSLIRDIRTGSDLMANEKECYGRMFPSVLELKCNEAGPVKAF
jgi:hypothetical protein